MQPRSMATQLKKLCCALSVGQMAAATTAQPQTLNDEESLAVLPSIVALCVGKDIHQTFSKTGLTEDIASSMPSTGRWWVMATHDCPSWPTFLQRRLL